MYISVVIPAYNEGKNVLLLHKELTEVLQQIGQPYEIIFVDDGSRDMTYANLLSIKSKDRHVRIIKFLKNFGQTAAWDAGFKLASGEFIVTMDSDLQNDPRDIPRMIKKISQGFDAVSGWRYNRKDKLLKRLFSKFSRFLRKKLIHDQIHDSGCSLKVYKHKCLKGLNLHGEMHRYVAELVSLRGYRVGELKINHRPRRYEKTKYSIGRLHRGFLDLLVVAFWQKYSARPIHLFGGIGLLSSFLGFVIGIILVVQRLFFNQGLADRPLLLLAVLLVILGIQFIIFGILADIMAKMYYSDKTNYVIEKVL